MQGLEILVKDKSFKTPIIIDVDKVTKKIVLNGLEL